MYYYKHESLWVGGGLLFWVTMLSSAIPVFSQDNLEEKPLDSLSDIAKIYNLEDALVTATQHKFKVTSTMPSQTLSGYELEKLNSFSVADAIRYFSGVQLKDYGGVGGIKTVNVRSLGSAHTTVFYDGMAIGNAQNGQVDLGRYSLDNIEAIELYSGQKSSIFQPARGFFSSNTLFLRTKIPYFVGRKVFNVQTSYKTGSFGLINPAVLYQQKLSQIISLSASVEWLQAHGRYKYRYNKDGGYDTTAIRQNGDIVALRTELTIYAELQNNKRASLKLYFYDSERGLPGAIVANRFSHLQRQWDKNFFVHGSLQYSFFKRHDLLVNLKFSRDYSRYIDPDYKTLEGILDNKYYQNEWYVSMVNQITLFTWWNVSLATDFSINTLDANLYRFPYPVRYSYLGAFSSAMKWKRLDIQANVLGGYIDEQVKYYQQGDSRKVFCPVVSLSVQPFHTESFRLRAFYKQSFRMPTFNDLYYTFVGNSSLRPEYTTQYDVGFTWIYNPKIILLRSMAVQADVYYNRVKDKIVAMPSSNLFRWTMMNLGEVEIKGVEANVNFGFQIPAQIFLDADLSYTFQKAIDITDGGTTYGHQIPYTPVHSGTFTTSVRWKYLQLNYSFIYTGERYSQKANIPVNYVQPWYTHDTALTWSGKIFKVFVKAGVEVNNLLNQYYDVVLNFPMPGRNYRINLSIKL